jgi:hypothetical protein
MMTRGNLKVRINRGSRDNVVLGAPGGDQPRREKLGGLDLGLALSPTTTRVSGAIAVKISADAFGASIANKKMATPAPTKRASWFFFRRLVREITRVLVGAPRLVNL